MTMKKILKEWKTYLKEEPDHTLNDNQVRLNVAKKMSNILFKPIREPKEQDRVRSLGGPSSIIATDYAYHVIYGTHEKPINPPNVEAGKMFVEVKVKYFIEKLTNRERDLLASDSQSLLKLSNFGEFPVRGIKLPVELTGREGIPTAFNVMFVNGSAASDWAMAGSLYDGAIRDYTFQRIVDELDSSENTPMQDSDLIEIYSKGQAPSNGEDEEPVSSLSTHPAAKMSYEELMAFIKSKQGK
jgi:hypothetical protein